MAVAAIGTWPAWSAQVFQSANSDADVTINASVWLREGPTEAPDLTRPAVWTSVGAVAREPEMYANRLVIITGVPVAVTQDSTMTCAAFEEDGEVLIAGYAGGGGVLTSGTSATVAGILSSDGSELFVLAASPSVPEDASRSATLGHLTLGAAAAFFLAAVLLRVRRGRDHKLRIAPVVAAVLVLLAIVASGCDVAVTTTVNADGSGAVETHLVTGEESMSELMDLPNAEAFAESWLDAMEGEGASVERTANQLKITRTFSSLGEFSAVGSTGGTSWSRLGAVNLPDGHHIYFVAVLDTATLYPDPPEEGADTSAYDELKQEIDESTMTYDLEMPGTVVGSNADSGSSWNVTMGSRRFLYAEALTSPATGTSSAARAQALWSHVVRWLWAAAAGLAVWSMLAYPWRRRKGGVGNA